MNGLIRAAGDRLRARARGLTIGVKLDLMMLVPLLALGAFAAGAVQDKLGDRAAESDNYERAELALSSGSFIHELQRERGLSGIAASSVGGVTDALTVQRLATEEARARLLIALEEFDAQVDVRFTAAESTLEARWDQLMAHRVALDSGELGGPSAMRPYTSMIEQLLGMTTYANALQSGGSSPSSLAVAHWGFLHAKERSALIRGILGTSSADGVLTEAERLELHGLLSEEQAYLHLFLGRAPRVMLTTYWEIMADSEVQSALLLRSELLSGTLVSSSPDGGRVFESLSGHVEGLFAVEREIVEGIGADATRRQSTAVVMLVLIVVGAAVMLVLYFVVLTVTARSIARPLVELANDARQIAEGDLQARPMERTGDAIGEIGTAFDDMRVYLTEMATAAEELAWGNLEIEVEPRSPADTFGNSLAAMTRRLSLTMAESEDRAMELEETVERLRKSEDELRHSATHDALTGLPNRTQFMDRLNFELERAHETNTEIAVAFLDLDKFKSINDTLGHETGDRLLQLVAQRVRARIRSSDTVGRLGGDEFALVLADLSSDPVSAELLERIMDSLSRPYEVNGKLLRCAPSLGIARYPSHGVDAETLLANADHAM
ncbi:MAG: diguanylate cyclase, partial [Dehalococcoidia bacterium]|nr:diguanylate cyclase [Dehalococcoidia bacterium]